MEGVNLNDYLEITPRFSYNRYCCLGSGNFGKVYKGWDSERKCQIAVKHIPLATLSRTKGMEQREINILKELNHPNVLEFLGSQRNKRDGLFLFLQFCQNGTLSDYLCKNRLTEVEALDLAKQLVSGMTYINDKGYLHRDLKPDNLLLTNKNQLKIADFGTARDSKDNSINTFQRCTPIYSAPEVYLLEMYNEIDGKYKNNCDVFSAGYILYEMLTGEQLTAGITTVPELRNFLNENKRKGGVKIQHPSLTSSWIQILKAMLDFNPITRPNFKQIGEKIQKLLVDPVKVPVDRSINEADRNISNSILEKCKSLLSAQEKENNYLISCLNILYNFQQEQSQLIPRVYKLLCLYFSLSWYCCLSEKGLSFLHNPDTIVVDNQSIEKLGQKILAGDKKILLEFVDAMANRVNRGIEQIRSFLIKQILPELQALLKLDSDNIERRVVEEYNLRNEFSNFRDEEYARYKDYACNFEKCVNNLFKTRAETEILTDSDLKIYLVLLLLTERVSKSQNNRPSVETVKKMERSQLIQKISEMKSKFI